MKPDARALRAKGESPVSASTGRGGARRAPLKRLLLADGLTGTHGLPGGRDEAITASGCCLDDEQRSSDV